jgi:hypothetical protein
VSSPSEIAEAVLKEHAIQPHWQRDREQIHGLLVEASEATRKEAQTIIGKLVTDKMQLGNQLVAAQHPQFASIFEAHDPYRTHWAAIDPIYAPPQDERPLVYKLRIERRDSDGTAGTHWLDVTPAQAEHILAYLSVEARAKQSGEQQ